MPDRFTAPEDGMVSLSGPPGCNACVLLVKVVSHTLDDYYSSNS